MSVLLTPTPIQWCVLLPYISIYLYQYISANLWYTVHIFLFFKIQILNFCGRYLYLLCVTPVTKLCRFSFKLEVNVALGTFDLIGSNILNINSMLGLWSDSL